MSEINLQIMSPESGTVFASQEADIVTFEGKVASELPVDADLYFRWYSSLQGEGMSMNKPTEPNAPTKPDGTMAFKTKMKTGAHLITFTVTDQKGESADDFKKVSRAGIIGGLRDPAAPYLIHVLPDKAKILSPQAGGALSRAAVVLEAELPWNWISSGKLRDEYKPWEVIWSLAPVGAPARPEYDPVPLDADKFVFDKDSVPPKGRFFAQAPLAKEALGQYRLTLKISVGGKFAEQDSIVVNLA